MVVKTTDFPEARAWVKKMANPKAQFLFIIIEGQHHHPDGGWGDERHEQACVSRVKAAAAAADSAAIISQLTRRGSMKTVARPVRRVEHPVYENTH